MTVKTTVLLTAETHERAMQLVQPGTFTHMRALVERAVHTLLEANEVHWAKSLVLRGELIMRAEGEFFDADRFQMETGRMFGELLVNPWAA